MALSRNEGSMLRDSKEKECPYSESDAPKMLDRLPEKGLIQLPESSCPEEIGRTNDPKYCKCHKIISHYIQKCKAFKRQVLQLVKEEKITLYEEDNEESDWSSNHIKNSLAQVHLKLAFTGRIPNHHCKFPHVIKVEDYQATKILNFHIIIIDSQVIKVRPPSRARKPLSC